MCAGCLFQITGSVNFTIPMTDLQNKLHMDNEIKIRALVTDNATALTMAAEKELKFATVKNNVYLPITISQVYEQKYFVPGLKYYSMVTRTAIYISDFTSQPD